MSSKKEVKTILSQEEITQVEGLLAQYQDIAKALHQSTDKAQAEEAIGGVAGQAEAIQVAFVKELAKTNETGAADVLNALHALSPHKELRKEARRALIRLESAKVRPEWEAPAGEAPAAVQVQVENPPRFWKGFATQSREEGEMQIFLCWEQGYEYRDAIVMSFLLDFWKDGVKDAFYEAGTKKRIDERLNTLRGAMATEQAHYSLVSCSFTEGTRLLAEALDVNEWRKTKPNEEYRNIASIVNKLILQAEQVGEDSGRTFITPELEEQEVAANFIGAWSFGDFGLAYDLLSKDNPLRANTSRDEWIELHRAWYVEAQPARMELTFIHEPEKSPTSSLWLPSAAVRTAVKKELDVGWSLELTDTPLSGTLEEMPMGTAVYKETGRHWFWNRYTFIKEENAWRIQQIKDEGASLQGLEVAELDKRIRADEEAINKLTQTPIDQNANAQELLEEATWRIGKLIHLDDALIARQPNDYNTTELAYSHAVFAASAERTLVYLERLVQKFTQNRAGFLRALGATRSELAYRFSTLELSGRVEGLLEKAKEAIQESLTLETHPMSYTLLAEIALSEERNEEAQADFRKAKEVLATFKDHEEAPVMESAIEAGLGNVAMRLKNPEEAIEHFTRVATLDPTYPGVWFSLGFANRLLGNLEVAEKHYLQSLQVDPGDIRTYSELTAIYMKSQDHKKARELLQQGIRIIPHSVDLKALYASALYEMGDKKGAQKHLEEAEKLDPDAEIIQSVRMQMARKHL